jgi:diketogulonate reductase-like aldo/keto reductase
MREVARDGAGTPALGLGAREPRGGTARRPVEAALEVGRRHADTARMYGSEAEAGPRSGRARFRAGSRSSGRGVARPVPDGEP